MKTLFTIFSILCFSLVATAQTDVYFKINHCLGDKPFAFNSVATNNLGDDFDVKRLQYYISEITVTYDGGQDTTIANTWILADASSTTEELLGSWNLTNIESVGFSIGVNADVNHLDPSTYPASHPLAHKSPSMHWGWTAGYRFVAMEGKSGAGLSQIFEVHALGDGNYYPTQITTSGKDTLGSHKVIELFADYEMALKDISVSTGLINHGETGEAADLLLNFRDHVFSTSIQHDTSTVGVESIFGTQGSGISVYPNPVKVNQNMVIDNPNNLSGTLIISDLVGREVQRFTLGAQPIQPVISEPGVYLISIFGEGKQIGSQKVIVTE